MMEDDPNPISDVPSYTIRTAAYVGDEPLNSLYIEAINKKAKEKEIGGAIKKIGKIRRIL